MYFYASNLLQSPQAWRVGATFLLERPRCRLLPPSHRDSLSIVLGTFFSDRIMGRVLSTALVIGAVVCLLVTRPVTFLLSAFIGQRETPPLHRACPHPIHTRPRSPVRCVRPMPESRRGDARREVFLLANAGCLGANALCRTYPLEGLHGGCTASAWNSRRRGGGQIPCSQTYPGLV